MKLPIGRHPKHRFGIAWKEASPFVDNSRAILAHRPRYIFTHKISEKWKTHISVECWCGNSFSGTKKFTFLDEPPDNKLLCARCEEMAVKHGQPSSEQLTGRHVHIGRLVPQQLCCN